MNTWKMSFVWSFLLHTPLLVASSPFASTAFQASLSSAMSTHHACRLEVVNGKSQYHRAMKLSTRASTTQLAVTPSSMTTTKLSEAFQSKYDTSRDLQEIVNVAERAAFAAGEIMREGLLSPDMSVDFKTSSSDLVTQFDLRCQQTIKETISSAFPNDSFLGEEEVGSGSVASVEALKRSLLPDSTAKSNGESLLWIVDPIDGTTNFQAGLPMFCTSIGVVSLANDNPEVVAGVIYNPVLDEMVTAAKGQGCYVNGNMIQKLRNKKIDGEGGKNGIALKEAVVNVGFPVYSEATLEVSSRAVSSLAKRVRGLRMIASASQVMAWVAQGKFNAYVSWDLNAWDVAAGIIIVQESGGYVSNFDGTRASIASRDLIITCNENEDDECVHHPLSAELLAVLKEAECLEY